MSSSFTVSLMSLPVSVFVRFSVCVCFWVVVVGVQWCVFACSSTSSRRRCSICREGGIRRYLDIVIRD